MKQWFVINNDKIPYIRKFCPDMEIIEEYKTQSKVSVEISSTNLINLIYSGVRFGMDKANESNRKTA